MDRCWLKGSQGDALHAVLCAAGFNIRWLLRAIARLGLYAACILASWLTSILSASLFTAHSTSPALVGGDGK
jgi:IS5 family transposase